MGVLLGVAWSGNSSLSIGATGVETVQKEVKTKEQKLQQLNQQMKLITDEICKLTLEVTKTEAAIQKTEQELKDKQEQQAKLYDDMKLRIQYMYENGGGTILEQILESKSLADFVNAVEYGNTITSYDRKMLKNYNQICLQIQDTQTNLKIKQKSVQIAKEDSQKKQQEIATAIVSAKKEIQLSNEELNQLIETAKENEKKLAAAIEEQQKQQWQESQKPKPTDPPNQNGNTGGEAQKPDPGTGEEPGGNQDPAPEDSTDLELLAALIECESGGEIYEGKIAVGSVVMNRVDSNRFPNNIKDVIYQGGQFAPASSGRLKLVLIRGANSSCVSAAKEVLEGKRNVTCLFFKRNTGDKEGTIIGNHVFY